MKSSLFTSLLVALCLRHSTSRADGVPEPGLVMYGQVWDTTSLSLVTSGNLTWTVTPVSGGAPVTVSAALTSINGQYSYRLRVPFEALLGSATLSATGLAVNASPMVYNRSQVYVNGTNAATLIAPALPNFTFKSADRGVAERVDLRVALPAGMNNPAAFVDSDGDGVSDADELRAGTNANDRNDYLHFTSIRKQTNDSVELKWSAVATRSYTIYRTTDLATPAYSVIRSNIPGIAPVTTLLDTNAAGAGPYFYRVLAE